MSSSEPEVQLEKDGGSLIHKECNGEVEPIPGHGLHCLTCDLVIETMTTTTESK